MWIKSHFYYNPFLVALGLQGSENQQMQERDKMDIKTIRYGNLAEDLLEIYKFDGRIQLVDSFDELVNFFQENSKDLIYKLEEEEILVKGDDEDINDFLIRVFTK